MCCSAAATRSTACSTRSPTTTASPRRSRRRRPSRRRRDFASHNDTQLASNNDTSLFSPDQNAGSNAQQGAFNLGFGDITLGDKTSNTATNGGVVNTGTAGHIDTTSVNGDGNVVGDGNNANTGYIDGGSHSPIIIGEGNETKVNDTSQHSGGDVITGNEGTVIKDNDMSGGHGGSAGSSGGGSLHRHRQRRQRGQRRWRRRRRLDHRQRPRQPLAHHQHHRRRRQPDHRRRRPGQRQLTPTTRSTRNVQTDDRDPHRHTSTTTTTTASPATWRRTTPPTSRRTTTPTASHNDERTSTRSDPNRPRLAGTPLRGPRQFARLPLIPADSTRRAAVTQPNDPRKVKVIVELIDHSTRIAGDYERGDLVERLAGPRSGSATRRSGSSSRASSSRARVNCSTRCSTFPSPASATTRPPCWRPSCPTASRRRPG